MGREEVSMDLNGQFNARLQKLERVTKDYIQFPIPTDSDDGKSIVVDNGDYVLEDIHVNVEELDERIDVLDARVDNIVALPEGSTQGDAELADIRVAYDGEIYSTAGDAVRGQVSDLNAQIASVGDAVYSNVLREVVSYPYGTYLNNVYCWVATGIFIPKGCAAKLSCLNWTGASDADKILHVLLFSNNGDNTFKVLEDLEITVNATEKTIYIPASVTKNTDVYIGFYSIEDAMCYQASGDRRISFKRFVYSGTDVGDDITLSGDFNLDFSFGLSITKDEKHNVVYVDANGNGDYTSVISAMLNEPENTVIFIKPGVYEQDMTECLKKRVILIGADRNQCIIRDTDGRYGHHPLYVSCGYFANITVDSPYISGTSQEIGASDLGSYAVHIDTDDDYAVGKSVEFHHCIITSDFFPAIGCGLRKDMTLIVDDCILANRQVEGRGDYADEGTLGALYIHDSNGEQGNQYVSIKDSILMSKLEHSLCLYQVDRTPQNNRVYCDFVNNVLYSDVGNYSNTVWYRGNPFDASTGIFDIKIGFGNSISSLNNTQ